MNTKLIWITPNAEEHIAYCARVSSNNQENKEYKNLLSYCFKHKHWSIFEMASACIEINTTRGIAPQFLRHRSFSFQEFSQRYSKVNVNSFQPIEPRAQDFKNRQLSHDTLDGEIKDVFKELQNAVEQTSIHAYERALEIGVSKESARFLLPLTAPTRLYMAGTIRSWLTYLQVRLDKSTQLEHRIIANEIFTILKQEIPNIMNLLDDNRE